MNATPEQFANAIRILSTCRGESNAITLDDLTARAGLPNRRTTEAMMELKLPDFPYPLVASGAGYFIPTSAEQLNTNLRSLQSRMIKLYKRTRTITNKAIANGWKREGKWFAKPPAQLDFFEQQK